MTRPATTSALEIDRGRVAFFIADLHLCPQRPQLTQALSGFLHQHAQDYPGCQLFVLGDLFDAWLGDDDDAPLATQVRHMLREFTDSGCALFIMHGNRDFLLRDAFAASTGAQLLPDPTVVTLGGEPTLLLHGDSLCTDDAPYQAFRAQVRQPQWQDTLLAQPLSERREIAAHMRRESTAANAEKSAALMDVNRESTEATAARYGVTRMIHGHTHRPHRHTEPWGTRWVLGDWGDDAWYLAATPEGVELRNYFKST